MLANNQLTVNDHFDKNAKLFSLVTGQRLPRGISGREIHRFLGIQKDFTDWVKTQIERAQLIEGKDFELYPQKGVNPQGGRPSVDYIFSIEAAKEICMMSGCEKGKVARLYFIEIERQFHEQPVQSLEDMMRNCPIDMIIAAANRAKLTEEKLRAAHARIEADKPLVEFARNCESSRGSVLVGTLAKILTKGGYQVGQNTLYQALRDGHYVGSKGNYRNLPTQRSIDQGILEIVQTIKDGTSFQTCYVTQKGLQYFFRKFVGRDYMPTLDGVD